MAELRIRPVHLLLFTCVWRLESELVSTLINTLDKHDSRWRSDCTRGRASELDVITLDTIGIRYFFAQLSATDAKSSCRVDHGSCRADFEFFSVVEW